MRTVRMFRRILLQLLCGLLIDAIDQNAVGSREVSTSTRADSSEEDSSMWPHPTYRPITWEKYYFSQAHEKQVSLTSGLAAGITIGVFFAVFLLTFGCRLYSQRSERRLSARSQQSRTMSQRRLSVSDFFACSEPPPPYHVAIRMPTCQPPPFTETPAGAPAVRTTDGSSTSA
ncbi:hypothetical protein M3Y99_01254800 [Aphelenchoides fujianensis]|nr:hypothetical protein M3Y99_01254800 [Aphelenchoides fujianensis]